MNTRGGLAGVMNYRGWVGWGDSEEGVMRRMERDLRAAAEKLFDAQQAPWWSAPPKKVQVKKKGSMALLRSRARRALKRSRQRRAQEMASASASAPASASQ